MKLNPDLSEKLKAAARTFFIKGPNHTGVDYKDEYIFDTLFDNWLSSLVASGELETVENWSSLVGLAKLAMEEHAMIGDTLNRERIQVTMTINSAKFNGQISLTASADLQSSDFKTQKFAWLSLWDDIQVGFRAFQANPPEIKGLPARKAPEPTNGNRPDPRAAAGNTSNYPAEGEVIQFTSYVVEQKGKKVYVALKGGKYDKHGIRVWPENIRPLLKMLDVDGMADLEPGEHEFEPGEILEATVVNGESGMKAINLSYSLEE